MSQSKQELKKTELNPFGQHSGVKARRWRQRVGALKAEGAGMRTIKFPLDLNGGTPFDFDEAAKLYDIVEGVGEGSLLGLLCATHLSGFRVFTSATEAKKFARKTSSEAPWKTASIAFDSKRPFIKMKSDDPFALHKVVALVAREVCKESPELADKKLTAEQKNGKILAAMKKSILSGSSPNALSWLFGSGLIEGLADREKTDQEVADATNVPKGEIKRIQQLRRFAKKIVVPLPFYKSNNYADFRVAVAQKVEGWISNYWERVGEYQKLINKHVDLPEDLFSEQASEVFRGLWFDESDLKQEVQKLNEQYAKFGGVVSRLRGEGEDPSDADYAKFDKLESQIAALAGNLYQLDNLIAQRAQRREDEEKEFWSKLHEDLKKVTGDIQKLKKLNQISGGAVDAEEQVKQTEDQFNALIAKRAKCCDALFKLCSGDIRDVFRENEQNAIDGARKQGRESSYSVEQLVERKILDKICHFAKGLSSQNRKFMLNKIRPLFKDKKDFNKHMHNQQGAIYRSPWSQRDRHDLFDVDHKKASKLDYVTLLNDLIGKIESRLPDGRADDLRDWLNAQDVLIRLRTSCLPASVPSKYSAPLADAPHEMLEGGRFSSVLCDQLRNGTTRKNIARALNLYQSTIRGLAYKASRDSFMARVVVRPIGQEKLLYVAKDKQWDIPPRYEKHFAEPLAVARDESSTALQPPHALERMCKGEADATGCSFLAQMPHDWMMPFGKYHVTMDEAHGVLIDKSLVKKAKKDKGNDESQEEILRLKPRLKECPALRLKGVASMKTRLDEVLRGATTRGEHSLILEQGYRQYREWSNGKLSLRIEKAQLNAVAAVPLTSPTMDELDGDHLFHNIVAIDLGERGIAYAVFDVRNFLRKKSDWKKAEPVETGMFPIPSIRRLRVAVNRYRGRAQPNQKVQESFSRALEKHRESVIGDVCHRIDFLCSHFKGFPILERDVTGLESGGQQLKLVYGSVVRRYWFSDVQAHKQQRADYWFSNARSKELEHPYLMKKPDNKDQKRTKKESKESVKLFPGVGVRAAGTSQICSCCGRNPLEPLKAKSKESKLEVLEGGLVDLSDENGNSGQIRLFNKSVKYSDAEHKKARKLKKNLPLNQPLEARKRKVREIISLVRFNLRQKQEDMRSRDTTQSVYQCVYVDCGKRMHADQNAAINIGRRFFSDRVDIDKSREKLAQTSGR